MKLKYINKEQKLKIIRSIIKLVRDSPYSSYIKNKKIYILNIPPSIFLEKTHLDDYNNPELIFKKIISESNKAIIAEKIINGINLKKLNHDYKENPYDYIYLTINLELLEKLKDKFNININTLYEYKKPLCETEEQWGYLKFNEYDDQIKIGNKNSRHFKLLDELLNHFDIQKNIESVFEYIKLPKDKQNANLNDQYLNCTPCLDR